MQPLLEPVISSIIPQPNCDRETVETDGYLIPGAKQSLGTKQ